MSAAIMLEDGEGQDQPRRLQTFVRCCLDGARRPIPSTWLRAVPCWEEPWRGIPALPPPIQEEVRRLTQVPRGSAIHVGSFLVVERFGWGD